MGRRAVADSKNFEPRNLESTKSDRCSAALLRIINYFLATHLRVKLNEIQGILPLEL